MKVSVVVVDSHPLVRQGLRLALAAHESIELVAACADDQSLWVAIDEHQPDVVVTAARLAPGFAAEGISVAQAIRRLYPRTGVVVVSGATNPEYVASLLAGGAAGRAYLLRERLVDRQLLVEVVHRVAAGLTFIDPDVGSVTGQDHAGFGSLDCVGFGDAGRVESAALSL